MSESATDKLLQEKTKYIEALEAELAGVRAGTHVIAQACKVEHCHRVAQDQGICRAHKYRLKRYGTLTGGNAMPGLTLDWIKRHVSYAESECLIWPFSRNKQGYPAQVLYKGKKKFGHRLMCIFAHGEPTPPRNLVRHLCGNGHLGCVNPKHLAWSTHKENAADRWRHGTMLCGEDSPNATLTSDQVRLMRKRRAEGLTLTKLAKIFDISVASTSRICRRDTWKNV